MKKKTLLSWSSGKDSAWALHKLRQDPSIELVGLFTSINAKYNRVSMHATRLDMLKCQADATGLPMETICLPDPCSNEQYENAMARFVGDAVARGIGLMAFGDLFLEGIRKYREDQLKGSGIEPCFPLWGIPTPELAEEMLVSGVEAYVSSVDLNKLPLAFAGSKWSKSMIAEFPPDCDPCGENGEIHTIVTGGPMFRGSIHVRVGEIVEREGFAYADIIPLQ